MNPELDAGVYIVVFHLATPKRITVGGLGRHRFHEGVYLYVGTAQRNLMARLRRHARRHKPLRWHIDYLSTKVTMLGAVVVPGERSLECVLAKRLAERFEVPIPKFGSSDCRCESHLFFAEAL